MPPQRSRRQYLRAAGAGLAAAMAGCTGPADEPAASPSTAPGSTDGGDSPTPSVHAGYETTEVRVLSPAGDRLGAVTAAIADTSQLRYLGLSDTESLPEDRGMLFVYQEVGDHTYVMREMDFGLDIVYADDEGTITSVHNAPAPGPDEDGESQAYPGRGQYVLEVNYGWTTDRGVGVGDRLAFEL